MKNLPEGNRLKLNESEVTPVRGKMSFRSGFYTVNKGTEVLVAHCNYTGVVTCYFHLQCYHLEGNPSIALVTTCWCNDSPAPFLNPQLVTN